VTRGVLLALALAAALAGAGCSGCAHKDDGTAPTGAAEPLPELVVKDDTPNLLLTWIDGRGVGHTEVHPRDVPPAGRELVRVVVSDREDGTRDRFYVLDLNKPRPDGSFVARTVTRRTWEEELEKRRAAYLGPPPVAETAPSGSASAPGPTPSAAPRADGANKVTVIIYGASWCHPCHQAAAWLKARGVPYVLKDIEADAHADAEMQGKLEAAGRRGGSIPVIDVQGQILVGFSEDALANALKRAGGGTVL
jgi:glutaredoxin